MMRILRNPCLAALVLLTMPAAAHVHAGELSPNDHDLALLFWSSLREASADGSTSEDDILAALEDIIGLVQGTICVTAEGWTIVPLNSKSGDPFTDAITAASVVAAEATRGGTLVVTHVDPLVQGGPGSEIAYKGLSVQSNLARGTPCDDGASAGAYLDLQAPGLGASVGDPNAWTDWVTELQCSC